MERPGALGQRYVPWFLVLLVPAVIAAVSLQHPARSPAPDLAGEGAYFLIGFPTEATSFVLLPTDPARIAKARKIIGQGQNDHYIFGGRIVKAPVA